MCPEGNKFETRTSGTGLELDERGGDLTDEKVVGLTFNFIGWLFQHHDFQQEENQIIN